MPENPHPVVLAWINSSRLRALEIFLWRHPKIAWAVFILGFLFVTVPTVGGAIWYSFTNNPPIPTILKEIITLTEGMRFSVSWMTVPVGVVMFGVMLYLFLMGRKLSKEEKERGGAIQFKATGTVTKPCPYQWLHEIANQQAENIAKHVRLEKPFTYDHRLNADIPSIGLKFPIRNYSVFTIGIEKGINGEIYYDGVELAEPRIIRYADENIGFMQLGGISIEQRLTKTEAAHIAKMQGTFHFSALKITIKGADQFPDLKPQRLPITEHEHSLSMQNETRGGSLIIKSARYGARDRWADVTAVVQALVVSERLKIDKQYNDLFREDPYPRIYKTLTIEFLHNGLPYSISLPEDTPFTLPLSLS